MEWKDIKSLTEKEARNIVKDCLTNCGFGVIEIKPDDLPEGKKSPDFIIKDGNDIFGYCEIKTPGHYLNKVTNLFQWNTTFNKLRGLIHTAQKQFVDYDPLHKKPWVIIFTSNHPQLNWTNFTHAVIGAVAYNGEILKDFRNESFVADSNNDLLSIDIIVWFQVNYVDRKNVYQVKFFINKDRPFVDEVNTLSNRLLQNIEQQSKLVSKKLN